MMNLPLPNRRFPDIYGKTTQKANIKKPAVKPGGGSSKLQSVSLFELIKPLMTAIGQSQPWVDDFGNDQVMLSADLYEVIREFSRLQRPADPSPDNK